MPQEFGTVKSDTCDKDPKLDEIRGGRLHSYLNLARDLDCRFFLGGRGKDTSIFKARRPSTPQIFPN